jgi:hypothetical protein
MPDPSSPVKRTKKSAPARAYVNGRWIPLDHSRVAVTLTAARLADLDRFCISRGYPRPREAQR